MPQRIEVLAPGVADVPLRVVIPEGEDVEGYFYERLHTSERPSVDYSASVAEGFLAPRWVQVAAGANEERYVSYDALVAITLVRDADEQRDEHIET